MLTDMSHRLSEEELAVGTAMAVALRLDDPVLRAETQGPLRLAPPHRVAIRKAISDNHVGYYGKMEEKCSHSAREANAKSKLKV